MQRQVYNETGSFFSFSQFVRLKSRAQMAQVTNANINFFKFGTN